MTVKPEHISYAPVTRTELAMIVAIAFEIGLAVALVLT